MITDHQNISEIVTQFPKTLGIFASYQIDGQSSGSMTVEEACRARGMDPVPLLAALEYSGNQDAEEHAEAFRGLSTSELIAKIVAIHHTYLRAALPRMRELCAAVTVKDGGQNPKLFEIERTLATLQAQLEPHLEMEEHVLFPMFLAHSPDPVLFRHDIVTSMYEDHELVGRSLNELRTLADGFVVPERGSDEYRRLAVELAALDRDTRRHLHMENSVLMPRFKTSIWLRGRE